MKFSKLLLATLMAAGLLSALVGSASARSFSTSSQTLRALFAGITFSGAFGTIACEVQLEGSLHTRTIAKILGSLIGYITSAIVLRCATNSLIILRESLPWHVRYASFIGALPNIAAIRANIVNAGFQIREPIITCLARSTAERPINFTLNRESSGALTTAELSGTLSASNCLELEGTLTSTRASVTALNSTSRITVTLI